MDWVRKVRIKFSGRRNYEYVAEISHSSQAPWVEWWSVDSVSILNDILA